MAACDIDIAMSLGLHKGMAMTDALAARLRAEDRRLTLRQKAYHFATYKPRTERQMRDKLRTLEAVPEEIEDVMAWLASFRIIDDAVFARRFVEASRERKPMSTSALRRALRTKGVADVHIEAALASSDVDADLLAARRVAEKKLRMIKAESASERREKLVRFLQYRGYGWDVVKRIVSEVC